MAKGWRNLMDNGIHDTGDNQKIINTFNAEIRILNSPQYKKMIADQKKINKDKKK